MFTKHGLQTRCVPGRNYSFLPLAEMLTWGHQHCSHMQQRFGPDTQSSDVEIEISHSEGPKWPQRSAGSPRVRPVVSHGERCRPELTSAAACASEALCAKKGARHLCPPPPPEHTLDKSKPRGTSHHLVDASAECNPLSQTDVPGWGWGCQTLVRSCRKVLYEVVFCGMRSGMARGFTLIETHLIWVLELVSKKMTSSLHPERGFLFPICFLRPLNLFS